MGAVPYELWKSGNEHFSEEHRLSVAQGPYGQLVAGYVCYYGPLDWRIEGDLTGRSFLTALDAADALTSGL